jgi:hypothetical protein
MRASSEHALEEDVERYSMATLPEAEAAILEEHLLICPLCQERLTESDEYLRAMRSAASRLRAGESSNWRSRWELVWTGLATSKLAWAGGATIFLILLLLASGYWHSPRTGNSPPVAVVLQTMRGADGLAGAKAPMNSPLALEADLSGLPIVTAVRLEVVDGQGVLVQRVDLKPEGGRLLAKVPGGLARGRYWVRLHAPELDHELLREYALQVE